MTFPGKISESSKSGSGGIIPGAPNQRIDNTLTSEKGDLPPRISITNIQDDNIHIDKAQQSEARRAQSVRKSATESVGRKSKSIDKKGVSKASNLSRNNSPTARTKRSSKRTSIRTSTWSTLAR